LERMVYLHRSRVPILLVTPTLQASIRDGDMDWTRWGTETDGRESFVDVNTTLVDFCCHEVCHCYPVNGRS